jgi:hypothetical protein
MISEQKNVYFVSVGGTLLVSHEMLMFRDWVRIESPVWVCPTEDSYSIFDLCSQWCDGAISGEDYCVALGSSSVSVPISKLDTYITMSADDHPDAMVNLNSLKGIVE